MKQVLCNIALAVLLLQTAQPAFAAIDPLRDPTKLDHPKSEKMLRVTTARVVLADYDLLKKDFPELHQFSNERIDQWLLDHVAYISQGQAAQDVVNTKISTGEAVDAYRPLGYGRAEVFKAGSGLIDAKGTGAEKPQQADHGNGIATVGEGIREFIFERMAHKILKHHGTEMDTVACYGVIDYGFDMRHKDGSTSPAGEILRQAHQRYQASGSIYDADVSLPLEKIFREYGITSSGFRINETYDKINIQGTADKRGILDFGAFMVTDHFSKPVRNLLNQRKDLMTPGTPGFVEPNPALQLPMNTYGATITHVADSKWDNIWVWSHELADHFRKGEAQRGDVERHIHNFLDPIDHLLAAHPAPQTPVFKPTCSVADRILNAFRK